MSDIVSYTVPVTSGGTTTDTTLYFKDANLRNELANVGDYIGFVPAKVIGLQADFENSTFTRLGEAAGLSAGSDFDQFPMYGGRRLCNLADDGTVNAWYGESGYTEDGSNGQVMVYQPKFYYKVVPLKIEEITETGHDCEGYHLKKANYFISDKEKDGFKVHPAFLDPNGNEMDGIYISSYEGSIYDVSAAKYLIYDDMSDDGNYTHETYLADTATDKFCSIAGVKPASGLKHTGMTRTGVESMCQNRGSKWHSENTQVHSMEQLLMVIEYGTFNMQTVIGQGVVHNNDIQNESNTVQTGATAFLSNGTGIANITYTYRSNGPDENNTADKLSVRYRGRENDWGNIDVFINGMNINGNGRQRGGISYYCDDWAFAESKKTENYKTTNITRANAWGYIKYFGWSLYCDWMFIPTDVGSPASSSLPIGDYYLCTKNINGYKNITGKGNWTGDLRNGPFSQSSLSDVTMKSSTTGGRICCLGPTPNS